MIFIICFLIVLVIFYRDNYKECEREVNKLHLECESYLNTLLSVGAIPEDKVNEKIKQMNDKYGEVKVNIK